MFQHQLKPNPRKERRRVGRGNGSGLGTFSTRGVKGQKARKSGGKGAAFEGGQTPLIRRMPKLHGFKSPRRQNYKAINFTTLEKYFQSGEKVTMESLWEKKLIAKKSEPVKILGGGSLTKKLIIELPMSKKAKKGLAQIQ